MENEYHIDPAKKDEIISAYMDGTKVKEIQDTFGVSRAAIYMMLRARGIAPNRHTIDRPAVTLDTVIGELRELERRHANAQAALRLAMEHVPPRVKKQIEAVLQ